MDEWEGEVSRSVGSAWLPWSHEAVDHCSFLWVCVETFYTGCACWGGIVPSDENNSQSVDFLDSMKRGGWKLMGAGTEQYGGVEH